MFLLVPATMTGMSRPDHQRAADYVAARRGALRMTQADLAEKAGVDVKTVTNLESGGRWPIARNRAKIATALGWEPGDMVVIANGGEPTFAAGDADASEREVADMLALRPDLRERFDQLSPAARSEFLHIFRESQETLSAMRQQQEDLLRRRIERLASSDFEHPVES